jgi:alkaline phosphatase D
MASLRAPTLGPIVGHTTDTTCRVWIRGGNPTDNIERESERRTVGVIGLLGKGKNPKIVGAWYFRLHREFDRTGIFTLGMDRSVGWYDSDFVEEGVPKRTRKGAVSDPLTADTDYVVRVGTLTIDDPLADDETLPDWKLRDRLPDIEAIKDELLGLDPKMSEATFRTFPKSGQARLSFILGSCRFPGWLWKIKEADRIFAPVLSHFEPGGTEDPARFTIMCGDQIYADTLNKNIPLMRADSYDEFQERYTAAFGSPNLRRLLRSAPNYMILDDHEIEDNWTQDRLRAVPGARDLFVLAVGAYMSYQWSHGPRTWGRLLYYDFECGGYPVFVLDERTQRYQDEEGLEDNHLLGRPSLDEKNHPGQLECLLRWLTRQQAAIGDAPKFIVSPSVFAPNAMDERITPFDPSDAERSLYQANAKRRNNSDSWPAYPNTRRRLLVCRRDRFRRRRGEGPEDVLDHFVGVLLAVSFRRRRSEQLRARFARAGTIRPVPRGTGGRHALPILWFHAGRQLQPHRHRSH